MTHEFFRLIPAFPLLKNGNDWFVRFNCEHIQGSWMCDGQVIKLPVRGLKGTGPAVTEPVTLPDYMLSFNGWSLFSTRFQAVIAEAYPGAMQFVPFKLVTPKSVRRAGEYAIGQALHIVDGIDKERTQCYSGKWERKENGTYGVMHNTLWISRRAVADYPIFRLDGCFVQLWVREDFRELVESRGITGCRFWPAKVS